MEPITIVVLGETEGLRMLPTVSAHANKEKHLVNKKLLSTTLVNIYFTNIISYKILSTCCKGLLLEKKMVHERIDEF